MTDVIITERERRLLTTTGFIEAYFEQCRICGTYSEAYEVCEEEYARIVGRRKYASYSSFKATLSRQNRKKLTKLTSKLSKK